MAAFSSNIDITSGGTYSMDIVNGEPSSQVASDLNGKFSNIQSILQGGLPETFTGAALPDTLQYGKIILFNNQLYYGNSSNVPTKVSVDLSQYATQSWVMTQINNIDTYVYGTLTTFRKSVNLGFEPKFVFILSSTDDSWGTNERIGIILLPNWSILLLKDGSIGAMGSYITSTGFDADGSGIGLPVMYLAYK